MAKKNQQLCPKTGKVRLTREEALQQALRFRRRWLARMSHYQCKHCRSWHVGNDRMKGPRGKGRRR